MPRFQIPCVIFAGGKSSRMGRDKSLLPFRDHSTLAEYQYRRLLPIFKEVYFSAKENKFPFDAPLVADGTDIFAPTSGLLAAFENLRCDFFALSVDTPFVDEETIQKVITAYRKLDAEAVIARSPSGSHPMCGIYTTKLKPKLEKMVEEENHRLGYLLKNADTLFVDFKEDAPFFNMNTPAEYEIASQKM